MNDARSANSTVVVRRSETDGLPPGTAGGWGATSAAIGAPHSEQNLLRAGAVCPHPAHRRASAEPHSAQNFAPSDPTWSQRGHCSTRRPLSLSLPVPWAIGLLGARHR
ncbi:hypothetical protein GCM10009719_22800 [Nocardioides kribbensis]